MAVVIVALVVQHGAQYLLATVILSGIVIAALNFAWQHAREIHAHVEEHGGDKTYVPRGTLFFASTARFHELFDPAKDPGHITVDCSHLMLADHSALAALQGLYERYRKAGKQLRVKNLSERNQRLLARVGIELREPSHRDADNRRLKRERLTQPAA